MAGFKAKRKEGQATAESADDAAPAERQGWNESQVADSIIKRHVALAAGAGLLPAPVVDVVALTGVQLNMIQRLSEVYDVEFSRDLGKNILVTLAGVSFPFMLQMTGIGVLKAIPGLGSVAGILALPALAAAFTYAVGKVMTRHYESGGDLLNFDAKEVQDFFREKLREGAHGATE